jgi:hypothetical protein
VPELSLSNPFKKHYDFIYFNYVSSNYRLAVPYSVGIRMGMDNTCKAFKEINLFFSDQGALKSLAMLQEDLLFMQSLCDPESNDDKFIKFQLDLIGKYRVGIKLARKHYSDIKNLSVVDYPKLPVGMRVALKSERANAIAIRLNPRVRDELLRFGHHSIAFSRDNIFSPVVKGFTAQLFRNLKAMDYRSLAGKYASIKKKLIHNVVAKVEDGVFIIESKRHVKTSKDMIGRVMGLLRDELKLQCGHDIPEACDLVVESIRGVLYDSKDDDEQLVDLVTNVLSGMMIEESDYKESQFIEVLFNLSKFQMLEKAEDFKSELDKLYIMLQFYMATINVYLFEQGIVGREVNLPKFIETNDEIIKDLVGLIITAIKEGGSIESEILNFFIRHAESFEFSRMLGEDDLGEIIQLFAQLYGSIKESPQFDEFIIKLTTEGEFMIHQGRICIEFSDFLKYQIFNSPQLEVGMHENLVKARFAPVYSPDAVTPGFVHESELVLSVEQVGVIIDEVRTQLQVEVGNKSFQRLIQTLKFLGPCEAAREFLEMLRGDLHLATPRQVRVLHYCVPDAFKQLVFDVLLVPVITKVSHLKYVNIVREFGGYYPGLIAQDVHIRVIQREADLRAVFDMVDDPRMIPSIIAKLDMHAIFTNFAHIHNFYFRLDIKWQRAVWRALPDLKPFFEARGLTVMQYQKLSWHITRSMQAELAKMLPVGALAKPQSNPFGAGHAHVLFKEERKRKREKDYSPSRPAPVPPSERGKGLFPVAGNVGAAAAAAAAPTPVPMEEDPNLLGHLGL